MSRRGRQKRHHQQEGTKTRVPIIPMLDMAFQLLAFGLSTFELAQIYEEGQFSLALPNSGNASNPQTTDTLDDNAENYTVRVTSDGNGRIDTISYAATTKNSTATQPVYKALPSGMKELSVALKGLVEAKKTDSNSPPPKLDVQFDPELNYQLVFEVLSAADAKFGKVSPNLLTKLQPTPAMP